MTKLEQMQERAREHIVDIQSAAYNTEWLENKLNNIVTEVWNEAIKEERERAIAILKSMLTNEGSSGEMYNEFKKNIYGKEN